MTGCRPVTPMPSVYVIDENDWADRLYWAWEHWLDETWLGHFWLDYCGQCGYQRTTAVRLGRDCEGCTWP